MWQEHLAKLLKFGRLSEGGQQRLLGEDLRLKRLSVLQKFAALIELSDHPEAAVVEIALLGPERVHVDVGVKGFKWVALDVAGELQIDGIDNMHCHLVVRPPGYRYSRMRKSGRGDRHRIRVRFEIYCFCYNFSLR